MINRIKYYDRRYSTDTLHWIGNLYSLLNRRDVFADFCSSSTLIGQWSGQTPNSIGPWDFLRQIIVTFELARRLEECDSAATRPGFTKKVLASLIVTDQWMRNVEVVLHDEKIDASKYHSPANEKERATAERFKEQADAAARSGDHDRAVALYSEAMNIDLANARYRIGRSKSFFALNKYDEAADDAFVATQLDLQDFNAWEQLAISQLSRGQSKKAKEAYEKAIDAAGSDATDQMRQGLIQADALIDTDLKMMDEETDFEKREHIWKSYFEQDWDLLGKTLQIHSHVHERQTEGLLLFAERLKWPYVDELRDYAEDIYSNLRGGGMIPLHLYDWIFGLSLPGQWFSFKIMSALILCTPSIAQDIGVAPYSDCGLSLPRQSYWRTQTALGRVLGALSGVISLNGWIGPCPPVEFYPPIGDVKAHHIRISSRRVAPIEYIPPKDGVIFVGPRNDQWEALRMQPNEEIGQYMQDMTDSDQWIIPEPPIQQVGTCEIQAIRLKQLPLDTAVAGIRNRSAQQVQNETQYRASITFQIDNNNGPISYILYTNPVFVSLPPCFPGVKGAHEVHARELARMQKNIVAVENLNQTVSADDPDDVLVINSTGHGAAEVLARAWCSERGKNAAIRHMGGPCFACAFQAASKQGLGVGVLIWVS
jgi:tetratricopeptide (TPR) repeat protein